MVVAAILASILSAKGAEVSRIQDADKFCGDVLSAISHNQLRKAVDMIAGTTGQPDSASALLSGLNLLDGKNFDFTKKVFDKDFNGALRQIVYYSYVDNLGFLYFRFNFKMTSTGFILSNFKLYV